METVFALARVQEILGEERGMFCVGILFTIFLLRRKQPPLCPLLAQGWEEGTLQSGEK